MTIRKMFLAALPLLSLMSGNVFAQNKFEWNRFDRKSMINENGVVFVKVKDYSETKGVVWYTDYRLNVVSSPMKLAGDADLYKAIFSVKPRANFGRERQPYLDFLKKHSAQDLRLTQIPGVSDATNLQDSKVCRLTDDFKRLLFTQDANFQPQRIVAAYPDLCQYQIYFFGDKKDEVERMLNDNATENVVKIEYSLPFCGDQSYINRPFDGYVQKLVNIGALKKTGDVYQADDLGLFFYNSVQLLLKDPGILNLEGKSSEAKWKVFFDHFVKIENSNKSAIIDLRSNPELTEQDVCVVDPFVYRNFEGN